MPKRHRQVEGEDGADHGDGGIMRTLSKDMGLPPVSGPLSHSDQMAIERTAELLGIPLSQLLQLQLQQASATHGPNQTNLPPATAVGGHGDSRDTNSQVIAAPQATYLSAALDNIARLPGATPYTYHDAHEWPTTADEYRDGEYGGFEQQPENPFLDHRRIDPDILQANGSGYPGLSAMALQEAGARKDEGPPTKIPRTAEPLAGAAATERRASGSPTSDSTKSSEDAAAAHPTESGTLTEDTGWTLIEPSSAGDQAGNPLHGSPGREMIQWVPVDPQQPHGPARHQQRRRAFQDQQLREQTGKTRTLKACVRCRMQKLRCIINDDNPNGICGTCMAVSLVAKVHHLPCLRHRLTECTVFRMGKAPGMEYTFRWPKMKLKDITNWASPDVRVIEVKSDVSPVPYKLSVREFVPLPQDCLHRAWMDGKTKKFYETTPYAIANMRSAMQDMREYITTNVHTCIDYFLKGADPLVKLTYDHARTHLQAVESEDERKLLGNYLRFWVAIRRTATVEHIIGEDKLGMYPETADKSFPLFGEVPLPPVMIQQLDMILTVGVLLTLQKQVLEDLQRVILANNPRSWMTIYLITFMSLHSCAKLTAENYRNARRQGLRRRFSYPKFIAERHYAANVFLSHYHYVTESHNPFNIDWRRRHATPFADLSTEDVIFLQRTKEYLEEKRDTFKHTAACELYENEMYFISQMYEEKWVPRNTRIDYDGGTIYDGPLKKYYENTNRT